MQTVSNGQVSALSGPTGSGAARDAASQRCSPVGWSTAKSACVAHSEIRLKTNGRWLLVVCAGKWRTAIASSKLPQCWLSALTSRGLVGTVVADYKANLGAKHTAML